MNGESIYALVSSTRRWRELVSWVVALTLHGLMLALFMVFSVASEKGHVEFLELNLGRISPQRLARLLEPVESRDTISPEERSRAPMRKLPDIDIPVVRLTEQQRLLLPEQVSITDDKASFEPPRPVMSIPRIDMGDLLSERKVAYHGADIDIDQTISHAQGLVETDAVGGDVEPVFSIEGQLRGRDFSPAREQSIRDLPPRTRLRFSLIVAPDGTVVDAIPIRKEHRDLETFARTLLRASHFYPLPGSVAQLNQTGRITITFAPRTVSQEGRD